MSMAELDAEALSMQMRLTELGHLRLIQMVEWWPKATAQMLEEGVLEDYLASWQQSAKALHESFLDPSSPMSAWKAAGATEQVKATDPYLYQQRAKMVPRLAWEMVLREAVLEPLMGMEPEDD